MSDTTEQPGLERVPPQGPGAPSPSHSEQQGAPSRPPAQPRRVGFTTGLLAKLVLLAAVNGLALYGLPRMIQQRAWVALAATALAVIAINAVYLSRRTVPLKYLLPGTIFLVAFAVVPVIYTAYIAFTNYGTGNLLNKPQAIERIERLSLFTPPDAVQYEAAALADGDELGLLLTDPDGQRFLGTAEGLRALTDDDVTVADDRVTAVDGFQRLSLREAQDRQRELEALRIPTEDGEIQLVRFTAAVQREQRVAYDPDRDVMVDAETGGVYEAVEGNFVAADGQALTPGWSVPIGPDHFIRAFTSPAIRGPFFRVFVWTFAFAVLSVLTTFALGLGLAVTMNHPGVRGQRIYRSLLIVPYAVPSFMTALIWAGMLNREFGVINRMFDAAIPWLVDPTMAKVSILLVNLWLGFPYMFLIALGALQGIPSELREAAAVDGASAFASFRRVVLPLLLVALSPLLIASFAFNFNNFNVIYLLTGGGPPIAGARTPAGHSDILISYTYRLAFEGGRGADYGFAAAISVIIFLLVASISAFAFRYTRAYEEIE